jgi:hypothetical protein
MVSNTLTNKEILDLAEECGFEFNDFGKWNCTTCDIFALVSSIEEHYQVLKKEPTDIMRTFRKHGFVPPSESKEAQ